MAVKPKAPAKNTKATARTPADQTTSGIALDPGFQEAKIFEVEYQLTCKCETFSAVEGHRSYMEDLGYRRVMIAVTANNLTSDGSFDTQRIYQLVRDQVVIPEFEGHEAVDIQIMNINNRSEMNTPTFVVL